MLKDEVIEKLDEIKELLNLKSYSNVIEYLLNKVACNLDEVISDKFFEFEEFLMKFTGDIELIELLRIVYLNIAKNPEVTKTEEFMKLKSEISLKLLELNKYISSKLEQKEV